MNNCFKNYYRDSKRERNNKLNLICKSCCCTIKHAINFLT